MFISYAPPTTASLFWFYYNSVAQIDVSDPHKELQQLSRVSVLADLTLMLSWSAEEAARVLEVYKIFEHKPPDLIMERQHTTTTQRVSSVGVMHDEGEFIFSIFKEFIFRSQAFKYLQGIYFLISSFQVSSRNLFFDLKLSSISKEFIFWSQAFKYLQGIYFLISSFQVSPRNLFFDLKLSSIFKEFIFWSQAFKYLQGIYFLISSFQIVKTIHLQEIR